MPAAEEFAEKFLRDVAGIESPDYVTKMMFIYTCMMTRGNRRRRRRKGRKRRESFNRRS
ncbi:MAG: hypothetical protein QW797_07855 [Thermoproteota archaeon]